MHQNTTGLELRSIVKTGGELELSLVDVPVPDPGAGEVVVEVQATPINPSDLGLLLGGADVTTLVAAGSPDRPVTTARISPAVMRSLSGRLDASMRVGNEGAGRVIAAGTSPEARALLGKTVATLGGTMYAQYVKVRAADCLVLPDHATPADGASSFVNPLTALAMVETMRVEGHKALIHTAAASNLGQMLVKICRKDGVDLVNVVRSPQQVAILRALGAEHVCDTSAPSFTTDLIAALTATGATIAFDAIGGGTLVSQILNAMEAAQTADVTAATYSRYGSTVHKQVYIYGGLDTGPTELRRGFGMAWSIGGFLVLAFLMKLPPARVAELRARVMDELTTTFASTYTKTISLREALDPAIVAEYAKRATGEKFLIDPSR